jgi:hypothetical protein
VDKRKRGQPPYKPTEADRNTVKTMAACGIPQEQIARCLGVHGIAPMTLRRHFRNELATAATQVNALAASKVIEAMKRGEAWACCFWLKCRACWKEKQQVEHSGPNDGGITLVVRSVLQPAEEIET